MVESLRWKDGIGTSSSPPFRLSSLHTLILAEVINIVIPLVL
jgi:hypothetical protein